MKIRSTPLHSWHVSHHANMAIFGGYEMPVWYPAGAKQEHLSVITNAGLFDTSHMSVVMVQGEGAVSVIQNCFSRDIDEASGVPLRERRCVYGVFLTDQGGVMDDAIVYRIASDQFMVIVNAGMGDVISRHLTCHMARPNTIILDLSDQVGKIDLQGLDSGKILYRMVQDPDQVFQSFPYFSFKGYFDQRFSGNLPPVFLKDGTPILISRTGYTGEFGFEVFIQPDRLIQLWELILSEGDSFHLLPCGLAARDSLRVGAGLPLSHQDIGSWTFMNNPWTFVLPFNADHSGFTKEFIGSKALLTAHETSYTYPFVGFDLRKVSPSESEVISQNGEVIGSVLTCVSEMAIGLHNNKLFSIASPDKPEGFQASGLACGFIRTTQPLSPNDIVTIRDSRRQIRVAIVTDIRPDRTARCSINKAIS